MRANGLTEAQHSLALLEADFVLFAQSEQNEIQALRYILKDLVKKYKSSAQLAILATSFEVAISEGK